MAQTALEKAQAQRIAELEAQNAALSTGGPGQITFRTSAKGGVSVYGMGRFPVTLYVEQWELLGKIMPELLNFCAEQQKLGRVKTKGQTDFTPPEDVLERAKAMEAKRAAQPGSTVIRVSK